MTLRYRAPEIMLGVREYNAAVDMWSVGCIMSEMLLGSTPFQGESEVDQLMKIFEALGRPTVQQWPDLAHCEHFHDAFPSWRRPADMSSVRSHILVCFHDCTIVRGCLCVHLHACTCKLL